METVQPGLVADGPSTRGDISVGRLAFRYLAARRHRMTSGTYRTYREALSLFGRHVGADKPARNVHRKQVERFVYNNRTSPATRRQRLSIVRNMYRWAVREGLLRQNPADGVESPIVPRAATRYVAPAKVGATMAACPDERALLIVALMIQCGLRAIEVARLQVGDVDFDTQDMKVVGKGGHQRRLPLPNEAWRLLNAYLAARPASAGPLIRSYVRPHEGVTARYISRMVGGWLKDAKVRETGHALRHSMAQDLFQRGADIIQVQTALGHLSIATTRRYLRAAKPHELRGVMEGREYQHGDRRTSSQ